MGQRAEERDAHEGSEQIELSKQYGGEFVLMFACGFDTRVDMGPRASCFC